MTRICFVIGVVFLSSISIGETIDLKKQDKKQTNNVDETAQKPEEFINIDNDWQKSFHKSKSHVKNQKLKTSNDDTVLDDEDSIGEGSGSGAEQSDSSVHLVVTKTNDKGNITVVDDIVKSNDKNGDTLKVLTIQEGGVDVDNDSSADTGIYKNIEDDPTEKVNNDEQNKKDECEEVECYYGATCTIDKNGKAACVCPVGACVNHAGNPVCGSDGVQYENPCELNMKACELQINITVDESRHCQDKALPECEERKDPRWGPWSMWFESGESEYRFRICINDDATSPYTTGCLGEAVQERMCQEKKEATCMGPYQKKKRKMYQCSGISVKHFPSSESMFADNLETEKGCLYSLYDATDEAFVHSNWTYEKLLEKGDSVVWCSHRGIFIPYTNSYKICHQKLNDFCSPKKRCKIKKKLKSRGDMKHKCWKEFLLDKTLPIGFNLDELFFICQKFSSDTDFAAVYGEAPQYGTLFDWRLKTPMMSFVRFHDIGHPTRPAVPYMIEKAMVKRESSILQWFTSHKKLSGMIYKETSDKSFDEKCKLGAYQSLLDDYNESPYQIVTLLSPSLIGGNVGKQIAALTTTNTVPMHVSIYNAWSKLEGLIRNYALNRCGIPLVSHQTSRRNPHNYPGMYMIAGRVASANLSIGNDVNVPYLIWIAGCCVKGAEASSFSAYVRNIKDAPVIVAPVEQLEILLSDLHNTTDSVQLFPAYGRICSKFQNDASQYIKL